MRVVKKKKMKKERKSYRGKLILITGNLMILGAILYAFSSVILSASYHSENRANQKLSRELDQLNSHHEAILAINNQNYSYSRISKKIKDYNIDLARNDFKVILSKDRYDIIDGDKITNDDNLASSGDKTSN